MGGAVGTVELDNIFGQDAIFVKKKGYGKEVRRKIAVGMGITACCGIWEVIVGWMEGEKQGWSSTGWICRLLIFIS